MLRIRYYYFLLLLFAMVQNTALSLEKVGTTSFQFLKVMNDARSTAMGEAYSAVVDNSDAMFWNPGALTNVAGTVDFSVNHTNWFLDVSHYAFSMAYKFKGIGTLGIMGLVTDVGTIKETTVASLGFEGDQYNPGLTGRTFKVGATVVGLAYARNLTDKYSFGFLVKYARNDIGNYAYARSMIVDVGMLYRTGFRSIQLASVIRHFGPEIKYYVKKDSTYGESYPLPQTFNIGVSAYLIGPESSIFRENSRHSLLASFDLIHPRDYDQQYGVGLEYAFNKLLFLRSGYKINYDEEGLCLGVGFKFKNYRIDYSYNDYGEYLGSVNRFSIGIEGR